MAIFSKKGYWFDSNLMNGAWFWIERYFFSFILIFGEPMSKLFVMININDSSDYFNGIKWTLDCEYHLQWILEVMSEMSDLVKKRNLSHYLCFLEHLCCQRRSTCSHWQSLFNSWQEKYLHLTLLVICFCVKSRTIFLQDCFV